MNARVELKKMLEAKEILVAPGAHDVLTARVIEQAGFKAVYMTGYGQAASALGKPDVGLLTLTEMVDRAAKFVSAVDVPVIADADTGFGNALSVMRTVELYEKAGVAAIQLEDQVAPKRCGHMLGRQVVPMEEMVGKIEAAREARTDENMLIIARTDARTNHGFEEALKRVKAYEAAGADIIFLESLEAEEEMEILNKEIKAPTLANMVEGGRTPLFTNAKLQDLGYNLVIWPTASTYVTAFMMQKLMKELMEKDTTEGMMNEMIEFPDFNKLIGLEEYNAMGKKFIK
ncbi:2,3-dimethylmalate lyase [Dethiosulfatibacter aminovorans DSM 17477]|uniref:2,3-dimethylmalate lyase n=1 Tax=Dethiosulfatibacter aminovorans DSM 17477 TaxID=1121476 RepID=A0A1M6A788_9FIRM|nr:isocitrate lyase/PEP mutase family protein [Dethiosulfatibacter aminovorans]SHI32316.1 2,3-dimethylmalate lyase [Dethiosulfatibacter aminovorans DSM 17477]